MHSFGGKEWHKEAPEKLISGQVRSWFVINLVGQWKKIKSCDESKSKRRVKEEN